MQSYLPTIITTISCGIFLWYIKRYFDRRDEREKQLEADRAEKDLLILQGVQASISLGEAAAIAVKNGKCNGETDEARKYACEIKHKIKDFMFRQASKHMVGG